MIYVFENENNNASWVNGNYLTEEYKTKGVALQELPVKHHIVGKNAILKCKKSENKVWWEFEDAENSSIETSDKKFSELEDMLGNLLAENAVDKSRILELENAHGDLLMELATLKMESGK